MWPYSPEKYPHDCGYNPSFIQVRFRVVDCCPLRKKRYTSGKPYRKIESRKQRKKKPMVSMVETSRSITNNYNNDSSAMDAIVTKPEPMRDVSVCSDVSTPEAEMEALTQDVTQTQKRKGGRKPVCKMVFLCSSSLPVLCSICIYASPGLMCQCARSVESGEPHAPPLAFLPHHYSQYCLCFIMRFHPYDLPF